MDAKQIKAIRKKLGMSQKELALEIGVDTVTVNRWENEAQRPSKLAIKQLKRLERKVVSDAVKAEIST